MRLRGTGEAPTNAPDRVVPLFVTGAPIYDSEGKLQYAMAAFVDISVQKSAEQKLAACEAMLQQRAVKKNDDWEDFWAYRMAAERRRLYPHTAKAAA